MQINGKSQQKWRLNHTKHKREGFLVGNPSIATLYDSEHRTGKRLLLLLATLRSPLSFISLALCVFSSSFLMDRRRRVFIGEGQEAKGPKRGNQEGTLNPLCPSATMFAKHRRPWGGLHALCHNSAETGIWKGESWQGAIAWILRGPFCLGARVLVSKRWEGQRKR